MSNVCKSIRGIGVDQGIANCGFAVVELTPEDELKILISGTIKTYPKYELSSRIQKIYETINQLSKDYNVSILGCERLFFSPKQKSDTNAGGRNKSASIVYTNMATGILHLIAAQNQIVFKDFVPGTVKKYVAGNGKATKDEVKEAVEKLVIMEKEIDTEHEADSIGIGITSVKYKRDLETKGIDEKPEKQKRKSTKKKGEVNA
ncbi:crossover junction endodeoxyribonuclease RuvC (plasmid) [Aneurinibacillus sp. Ricciae_BoGa-3]|uniref:crossover junction endodeoxyribonuclease RuvC n=1 Tax=Aneurinibacillus sp. Ricciae_BoGa-3 TaxID=3022697 RepID=UPI002341AE80|nr:crossover junction endodeoxyribonuclease RuvC [Aneurinibacillus sp. Ricciae_BoGa-3]WCK56957.1 crossover junction endodeoxyribonuclease RuvC [Aneurinibacillus sp. Ricciae_BoGa-3]